MANFMDYLDWRGDLSLEQSPFNEVDNLILSYLSYVKLDDVVPGPGEGSVTVQQAAEEFFEIYTEEDLKADKSFIRMAPYMLKKMGTTVRFGQMELQNFVNHVDTVESVQFSAMEIIMDEEYSYISYRGTDDTIVGWKEDFNLSTGVVPAEEEAVAYLNGVGVETDRKLLVGGHSKGGNLSIYAAVGCEGTIQDRIEIVYNNDGPGFTKEFLESEDLVKMRPRIQRFIPESSIIGMLLEHTVEPHIIKSSQKGPLQHDGFSWEVMGNAFPKCKELSSTGKAFDETLRSWLTPMDAQQRKKFIDEFFSVLEAPGTMTLTEMQNNIIKSGKAMLGQLETLSPESKQVAGKLIKTLMSHWTEMLPHITLPSIPGLHKAEPDKKAE